MRTIIRPRPESHRATNDAASRAYGRHLRARLIEWARSGEAPGALASELDALAVDAFTTAYLAGKHQAYPHAALTPADRHVIFDRLARNRQFLNRALALDVQQKLNARGATDPDERARIVDRSFGARVENQYGGVLWSVHEAGYVNGWLQLGRYTRRFLQRRITQEAATAIDPATGLVIDNAPDEIDDELDDPEAQTTQRELAAGLLPADELALALGISVIELNALANALVPVQFGTHYEDAGDEEVCIPCVENAESDDGDYWEPEQAPIPGDDCRGGGNCRCTTSEIWRYG